MSDMYRWQIGDALLRIDELMKQKKEIDEQLTILRNLAQATAFMLPDGAERDAVVAEIERGSATGFTATIRNIIQQNPRGLTPPEIRDALFGVGYDLSNQVNPLASIHSVLRRLVEGDEIQLVGQNYRWKGFATPGKGMARAMQRAAIISSLKDRAKKR